MASFEYQLCKHCHPVGMFQSFVLHDARCNIFKKAIRQNIISLECLAIVCEPRLSPLQFNGFGRGHDYGRWLRPNTDYNRRLLFRPVDSNCRVYKCETRIKVGYEEKLNGI